MHKIHFNCKNKKRYEFLKIQEKSFKQPSNMEKTEVKTPKEVISWLCKI